MKSGKLVLTRKIGQKIMIGEDIVIEFLDTKKGEIRVGITAPDNIAVHREEVYWRIKNEAHEPDE